MIEELRTEMVQCVLNAVSSPVMGMGGRRTRLESTNTIVQEWDHSSYEGSKLRTHRYVARIRVDIDCIPVEPR